MIISFLTIDRAIVYYWVKGVQTLELLHQMQLVPKQEIPPHRSLYCIFGSV